MKCLIIDDDQSCIDMLQMKLKDYYGLMGSAQNTSDTLDVAQEYFKNCINSQIVDEDYLDQCWEKVRICQ